MKWEKSGTHHVAKGKKDISRSTKAERVGGADFGQNIKVITPERCFG